MARDFAKSFYASPEWADVRRHVLMRDRYLCVRCGAPAKEVHHIKHLDPETVWDPSIALNPDNLESLCRDCHFKEHREDKARGHMLHSDQPAILPAIEFGEDGQVRPVRAEKV